MDRIIIHVDMDAFFASVEIRDDPTLKGKPLIIGALPGERGVVATASYEARKYGVHSAMNIREAYRLCPNGIYMHPNGEKYREVSGQLNEIWSTYATAKETVAFDEAYLDVTEKAGDLEGARRIARTIKERTLRETGLTCSIGLAYSKTSAKTASEEKKPDGYFEILTPEDFVKLVDDRDVRVLYTVGEMTAGKLYEHGIKRVRDIRQQKETVISLLGKQGEWITRIAEGLDDRPVVPYRPEDAKSIGREVTFQKDVTDRSLLEDILVLLALCVERRARKVGLHARGVTLKITFSDMKGITRSRICFPSDSAYVFFREARLLLSGVDERPVRLIGLSIYNLAGEDMRQMSIEDVPEAMPEGIDENIDTLLERLRERYGLDFAGHLEEIYSNDVLHRTVEYMRKYALKYPPEEKEDSPENGPK